MTDMEKDPTAISPETPQAKSLPKGELKMLALLFVVSAALFADSLRSPGFFQGLSKGPGSIPQLVSGALILMIIGLMISTLRKGYKEGSFSDVVHYLFNKEVVQLLVAVGVYGLIIEPVGFVLSSILFLVVTMYILDRKQIVRKILISVGTIAMLYLIFSTLFQVVLP